MNKNRSVLVASALLLSAAPISAQATLQLNSKGNGQALYIPYYTVEGGKNTLLTLTNHHPQKSKAVLVRFVEAYNGRSVLAFNVYLGPNDSWAAALAYSGRDEAPVLTPAAALDEHSCTFPALGDKGQPFSTAAFTGANADGGPSDLQRASTGSIEIIELGELDGESSLVSNCAAMEAAWGANGIWQTDPNAQVTPPGGWLSASVAIIQVEEGYSFSLPAKAITGFSKTARHARPETSTLRLTDPQSEGENIGFEVQLDNSTVRHFPAGRGADAVSALFTQAVFANDYSVNPLIGAQTEWVVAFPTKHAYVDVSAGTPARLPFTRVFGMEGACESAPLSVLGPDGQFLASPVPPPYFGLLPEVGFAVTLCHQVQTIRFSQPITLIAEPPYGHVQVDYSGFSGTATPEGAMIGLPVVAYTLTTYRNANAQPGLLATYATVHESEAAPTAE